jgi:hypothetical protein
MGAMLLRTKVKPESTADVEAALKKVFAALDEAGPQGLRYSSYRLPDGVSFVVLLDIAEGTENPLPGIPAFLEFQEGLRGWLAEPPVTEPLTLVGDYSA